jgi:hypothetical protein
MKSWPQITKELTVRLKNLRGGAPEVMKAFVGIAQAALAPAEAERASGGGWGQNLPAPSTWLDTGPKAARG